ncbi:MAG: PAS domain S-box protein, partial [Acidobacteria bacterium]|nr:PAS domain S-box protein [Acidobacteriota bacterium]
MTILIVDDNEQDRYQLQVLLGASAYQVFTAANGAEALAAARQNPPDLIVSDILMPVMDGFSLCREWKKDDRLRAIPFVIYTATYTDERDRDLALGLGAERFIVKPVEPEDFLGTIRDVLQEVYPPPAGAAQPAADAPSGQPACAPHAEEAVYLKQYNEALIRKLERKMQQLEQVNRRLEQDIAERRRADEALRQRGEELAAILDILPAIVWIGLDPECHVITGNRAANELTGTAAGTNVSQTVAAAGQAVYLKQLKEDGSEYRVDELPMQRATALGKPVHNAEIRFCFPDGRQVDAFGHAAPLFDPQGQVRGAVAAFTDITERKQAEEKLRRQTAVTAAINRVLQESLQAERDTEVARIGLSEAQELTGSEFGWIGEVNSSGRLDTLALSDSGWDACRIPGAQAATVKDMEIRGIFGRVLKDGESLITNEPGAHPDRVGLPIGHPELTAFLGVPLKQDGRTIGMVALGNKPSGYAPHDQEAIEALSVALVEALQRKRVEAAQRRSETQFRSVWEGSRDAMRLTNGQGVVWLVNQAFCDLVGKPHREIEGQSLAEIYAAGQRNHVQQTFLERYARRDFQPHMERKLPLWNGNEIWLAVSTSMVDLDEQTAMVLDVFRDITERRRAEEALRESEERYRT